MGPKPGRHIAGEQQKWSMWRQAPFHCMQDFFFLNQVSGNVTFWRWWWDCEAKIDDFLDQNWIKLIYRIPRTHKQRNQQESLSVRPYNENGYHASNYASMMINKGLDQWYASGVTLSSSRVVPLTHIKHIQQIYSCRMTWYKPVHVISHIICVILFTDYSVTRSR